MVFCTAYFSLDFHEFYKSSGDQRGISLYLSIFKSISGCLSIYLSIYMSFAHFSFTFSLFLCLSFSRSPTLSLSLFSCISFALPLLPPSLSRFPSLIFLLLCIYLPLLLLHCINSISNNMSLHTMTILFNSKSTRLVLMEASPLTLTICLHSY